MKSIALPPTSHQPQPYTGPSAEEVMRLRKQYLNPGLFLYYKQPIMIVELQDWKAGKTPDCCFARSCSARTNSARAGSSSS